MGISIESDKEILIKADESLTLISETDNINTLAHQQITLVRGETSLVMDDDVVSTGQEILVHGVGDTGSAVDGVPELGE